MEKWVSSDNLSNLVVIPLKDTEHTLLHENFLHIKGVEHRGLSKPVLKYYQNVASVKYDLIEELPMGSYSASYDWNIMSDLKVSLAGEGIVYFCFANKKIPFTTKLFKKHNINYSPLPTSTIIWLNRYELPYILVDLEVPSDVVIQFDKIYTPTDLGSAIKCTPKFRIPIEGQFITFENGYMKLEE